MGRVYHLREARMEEMEEMREYPDDTHLMDIYSFPEYQVEVEVATNVGTTPYMAMWVLFLGALLSTLCHPARALLDYCRQLCW
jgi:hypothetical protein